MTFKSKTFSQYDSDFNSQYNYNIQKDWIID